MRGAGLAKLQFCYSHGIHNRVLNGQEEKILMALELPSGQQAACPNARKPGAIVSPRTRSLHRPA